MVDHSSMKLGKLAPSDDPRNLRLAKYVNPHALPPVPTATNRVSAEDVFPMFLNDQLGDCTCAAAAHMQQFWGYLSGNVESFTDNDVLTMYEAVGGYVPGDSSTDCGAVETNVLNYWRRTGIAGRTIYAYARVDVERGALVRAASWLFDGLYIGVALPVTAQSQDIWDVTSRHADGAPGSWGGHAVPIVDYDVAGLTCVTWGALKRMTWAFWHKYVDEAYAVLSHDALDNKTGLTSEGFAFETLQSDLNALTC